MTTAPAARTKVILEVTNQALRITRALLLYRLVQFLLFPFIVVYFAVRLALHRAYWSNFGERLGLLPRPFSRTESGCIWLHAVSVGEVVSAIPLIRRLRNDRPRIPIYVSTSTVAGRATAEKQIAGIVNGIFYAPIDYASCVRRVLRRIRPGLLIILETEIWPNLYAEAKRCGVGLAIVNGRISDRTWSRYLRADRFFGSVLGVADAVMVQGRNDYARYQQLHVPPDKLSIPGNLKYDAAFLTGGAVNIPIFGARQIWIAASTVGPNERGSSKRHTVDEDEIVIQAFQQLAADFPSLLLILAPRQPARFAAVASKLRKARISFVRRSDLKRNASLAPELPGVLLLDSMGELPYLYPLADAVFVGGSIAPRGGHNILEPAAAGAPIVVGAHMQNFQAIVRDFIEASAVMQVRSAEELAPAIYSLLTDRTRAIELGNRGRALVQQQQGVAARVADRLWPIYFSASPESPRGLGTRLLLASLGLLWSAAGNWKRRRAEFKASNAPALGVPVISVGGITIGGSGKTPFTNYLARSFATRGFSPAILTRGYRRKSSARSLVLAAGARIPQGFTGDESQIFLRTGAAAVGIGTNRYQTANVLLPHFPNTDILLLDDGFQHASLQRDVDIVLIDGLDPFGGEHVVPLGRLREPLDCLSRADMFVITRAEDDSRFDAIQRRLRAHRPQAPVYRTRLIQKGWRDFRSRAMLPTLGRRRVAAFCGLGNPQNFWNTLESLGLEIVFRWPFPDHHQYKPFEIRRMADQARVHGASILVTTEKDRINLPPHLDIELGDFDLAWLQIELELDDEAGFFSFLDQKIGHRDA